MRLILLFCIQLFLLSPIFCSGKLIEVCGIDGAGKTTFINDLYSRLTQENKKVIIIKPLRGDPEILLFLNQLNLSYTAQPETQKRIEQFKGSYFFLALLTMKDKLERLPEEYDFIICDRYLFSFRTYQECFGQYTEADELLLAELPLANISFFITTPVDTALQRIHKRTEISANENKIFLEEAQKLFNINAEKYFPLICLKGTEDRLLNLKKALFAIENLP